MNTSHYQPTVEGSPSPSRPSLAIRRGLPVAGSHKAYESALNASPVTPIMPDGNEGGSRSSSEEVEAPLPIVVSFFASDADGIYESEESRDAGDGPPTESNSHTLPPPPSTEGFIMKMRVAGRSLPMPPNAPRPQSSSASSGSPPPSSAPGSSAYVRRALVGPAPIHVPVMSPSFPTLAIGNMEGDKEAPPIEASNNYASKGNHNAFEVEMVVLGVSDKPQAGDAPVPRTPSQYQSAIETISVTGAERVGSFSSSFSPRSRPRQFQQQLSSVGSSNYFLSPSHGNLKSGVGLAHFTGANNDDDLMTYTSREVSGMAHVSGSRILSYPMAIPPAGNRVDDSSLSTSFDVSGNERPVHIKVLNGDSKLQNAPPHPIGGQFPVFGYPNSTSLTAASQRLHTAASTNSNATMSVRTAHSIVGLPDHGNTSGTTQTVNTHTTSDTSTTNNSRAAKSYESAKAGAQSSGGGMVVEGGSYIATARFHHPLMGGSAPSSLQPHPAGSNSSAGKGNGGQSMTTATGDRCVRVPSSAAFDFACLRSVASMDSYADGAMGQGMLMGDTAHSGANLSAISDQFAASGHWQTNVVNPPIQIPNTHQWLVNPKQPQQPPSPKQRQHQQRARRRGASSNSVSSRSTSPLLTPIVVSMVDGPSSPFQKGAQQFQLGNKRLSRHGSSLNRSGGEVTTTLILLTAAAEEDGLISVSTTDTEDREANTKLFGRQRSKLMSSSSHSNSTSVMGSGPADGTSSPLSADFPHRQMTTQFHTQLQSNAIGGNLVANPLFLSLKSGNVSFSNTNSPWSNAADIASSNNKLIPMVRNSSPRTSSHMALTSQPSNNGLLSVGGAGTYGAGSVSMLSQLHGAGSASANIEGLLARVLPVKGDKGGKAEDGGKCIRPFVQLNEPINQGHPKTFHAVDYREPSNANNSSALMFVPSIPNNIRFAPMFEGMPSNLLSLDSVHASRMASGAAGFGDGAEGGVGILGKRTNSRRQHQMGAQQNAGFYGGPLSSPSGGSAHFGLLSQRSGDIPYAGFGGFGVGVGGNGGIGAIGGSGILSTPSLLGRCLVYQPSMGGDDASDPNANRLSYFNNNNVNATLVPSIISGAGEQHSIPVPLPFYCDDVNGIGDDEDEGDRPVTLVSGLAPAAFCRSEVANE